MAPHSPVCPGESAPPVVITMTVVMTMVTTPMIMVMMMLFMTIMMICTTKTLLRWLTMPAPMESPRTLIAVRNLKENIILGSKNIYHHPQPGCKHYDDSYWYDDGDVCRPIKQPVHREDDGDRLTGKPNLMRVSLKLFNPIAFFLLGNFYMIILSCATHCVENHDHSNKPCLKGLS